VSDEPTEEALEALRAFEINSELLRSAKEAAEAALSAQTNWTQQELAALRAFEIDPELLRVVSNAAVAAAEWIRQVKHIEATRELERDFLPKLAVHGWLLSPSGSVDQPWDLRELFEKDGIAAVDRYLDKRLDAEACRVIVDEICARDLFAPWHPTFDKALAALGRGDHELAIPIWLAALEFACRTAFGVKDVYSGFEKKKRKVAEKELASLSKLHEPLAMAWLEVLLGFSGDRGRAPAIFHRHAVMHGERPLIGTRKDALQCLLALEVLGYLIDARNQDAAVRQPK